MHLLMDTWLIQMEIMTLYGIRMQDMQRFMKAYGQTHPLNEIFIVIMNFMKT